MPQHFMHGTVPPWKGLVKDDEQHLDGAKTIDSPQLVRLCRCMDTAFWKTLKNLPLGCSLSRLLPR